MSCFISNSISFSLRATVNFHRPDLVHSDHLDAVIAPNPPVNFFTSMTFVFEEVKQIINGI